MTTAKKNAFVLNTPSVKQLENERMVRYGLAKNFSALSKRDQRLDGEINTQRFVLEGYELKSLTTQHHMGNIHQQGVNEIKALTEHYAAIDPSRNYQSYVQKFIDYDFELMVNHMTEISDAAQHMHVQEMLRPLDVPAEPEVVIQYVSQPAPPKGWLERLLGG